MGGWTEVLAARRWSTPFGSGEAVKVFLQNASGADDLPVYGGTWPGAEFMSVVDVRGEYVDGNETRIRMTVRYSPFTGDSEPPPANLSTATAFADAPRTMDFGMTTEQIDDGTNAYWNGTTNPVNAPRFKRIPTTTIRYSKIYTGWASLVSAVMPRIGKVSGASFDGLGTDSVMFAGCSAKEFRNSAGTLNVLAEFTFDIRQVPITGGSLGGWNYLYNEADGEWQLATPVLYSTANMSALF